MWVSNMIPNFIDAPLCFFAADPADRLKALCTMFPRERQAVLSEPLLECRQAIVTPKRFALEEKKRDAEYVVRRGLVLRRRVGSRALVFHIFAILRGGKPQRREQRGSGLRIVGLELAAEERFVDPAAVLQQPALRFGEQAADERGRGIVNILRRADQNSARLGPAARVEVGVLGLVIGIDAALAAILDSELERNPSYTHGETFLEREGRIEGQIRERTFVVRVHLEFLAFHAGLRL